VREPGLEDKAVGMTHERVDDVCWGGYLLGVTTSPERMHVLQ